jgi:hypothetical protein
VFDPKLYPTRLRFASLKKRRRRFRSAQNIVRCLATSPEKYRSAYLARIKSQLITLQKRPLTRHFAHRLLRTRAFRFYARGLLAPVFAKVVRKEFTQDAVIRLQ